MTTQPAQFAPVYASIFGDASVVNAYVHRPPYPPETFDILMGLIDANAKPCAVLDAGCGLVPLPEPWRRESTASMRSIPPRV